MRDPVIVTGAAGFIAFHLIERLLRDGQPVVGFDCFDPFYSPALKERNVVDLEAISRETGTPFGFRRLDLAELEAGSLDAVLPREQRCRAVVHLAAKAGVRPSLEDPVGYAETNVSGLIRVLEWSRLRGITHVLFGSSSSVYGNSSRAPFSEDQVCLEPISPYAATKRAGELLCSTYCHLYGLKIAALRFFTVYGPRQRPDLAIRKFADAIAQDRPITLFGDGKTSRDYTFATDIASGVVGALGWLETKADPSQFAVFNLGGSRTTELVELVRMIEAELGKTARIQWQPAQPGDVETTYADASRSRAAFGYSPEVPIREGIARFIQWHRSLAG